MLSCTLIQSAEWSWLARDGRLASWTSYSCLAACSSSMMISQCKLA